MDGTGKGRAAASAAVYGAAVSRRQAIVAVTKVTTAAGLVLAGTAAAGGVVAAAQPAAPDREVVAQLLDVEREAFALYREGRTRFLSDEATSGDRMLPTQPTLARIWDHERSHLNQLSGVATELGVPSSGSIADFEFDFADFSAFLRRAAEVKQQHVAAYVAAVVALDDLKLRSLVAEILAVEARHAAYLNTRVDEQPF